jgi:molybdate transport system regulatory protein
MDERKPGRRPSSGEVESERSGYESASENAPGRTETGRGGTVEARTKVYLTDGAGRPFLGIGVIWLLRNIREHGSIRAAAGSMQLSYAKAHRMIDDAERGLGFELVVRKRGGDSREGARLTPGGIRFTEVYEQFQNRIKLEADRAFEELLPVLEELSDGKNAGRTADPG